MKKNLKVLLLLAISLTSCGGETKQYVSFGSEIMQDEFNSNKVGYSFNLNHYISFDSKYDNEKAKMGVLFCANHAKTTKLDFENSKYPITSFLDFDSFYKHFDLDDYTPIYVDADGEYDKNDVTTLYMSHKKVESKEVVFCVVQETSGEKQWSSDFDVGSDSASYYDKTGQHPEWVNKENHKGFDIAANRAYDKLLNYISTKITENCDKFLYIYGHSRGGAVGNLLAKKMIDEGHNLSAYLYSSPATTVSKDVNNSKYDCIHNYANKNDILASILNPNWGFARFGITEEFDLTDYKEKFEKVNGFAYPSRNIKKLVHAFHTFVDSREEIYEILDKFVAFESSPFDSEEEARNAANEKLSVLDEGFSELRNYTKVVVTTDNNNKYISRINMSVAFFLKSVEALLGSDSYELSVPTSLLDFFNVFLDYAGIQITYFLKFQELYSCIFVNHSFNSFITYFDF